MISTLVALPYKIARVPLSFVDSTLSQRLPETSVPRTTLDLVIGSTDKLAGALLGDQELSQRGTDRIERAETLRRAGKREAEADTQWAQAEHVAVAGQEEAERKRKLAQDRAAESLDVADVVEARERREAKDEARKSVAARQRASDQKAERRNSSIEQRKQRATSAAEAKRKTAQRQAKTKVDEARKTEQDAAQTRADAERLSSLAETKKQERKDD